MPRRLAVMLGLAIAGTLAGGTVAPAAAAGPVRFGNTLKNDNGTVKQPNGPRLCDNGGPDAGDPCTLVSVLTSQSGNTGAKAPKDGRIRKVRVVAAHAGSFRLYFAKAKPGTQEARIVKKGPIINFDGDDSNPYTIEIINVDISVKKGWYIATRASGFEAVSCTSGSPAQLEFQPPLVLGDPFATADGENGCYQLIQLQYG